MGKDEDLKQLRKDLRLAKSEIKYLNAQIGNYSSKNYKLANEVRDLKPYKETFDKCDAVMDLTKIYDNEMSDKRLEELNKNKFNRFSERFNNLVKRLIRKGLE